MIIDDTNRLDTRQQYQTNGIAFPMQVMTRQESVRFLNACEQLEVQLGGNPRTIEVRQMHMHLNWAFELATLPAVLDCVETVLGPNILIWATELFAKRPQDKNVAIGWHRDRPYMGFENSDETTTAWIALTDTTAANGCMQAIVETDRRAGSDHVYAQADQNPAIGEDVESIDVLLQAGQMSLHDPYLLHGSAANRSDTKRVGFAIRFVTPHARPQQGRPAAVLVRGHDDVGNFELVDPPRENNADDAVQAMRRSADDHLQSMLDNLRHSQLSS